MTINDVMYFSSVFIVIIIGIICGLLIGFYILKIKYKSDAANTYSQKEISKRVAKKLEKIKLRKKKEKEKKQNSEKKVQDRECLLDKRIEQQEGFSEYMCGENGVDIKSYTESVRKTQDKKYNRNKK